MEPGSSPNRKGGRAVHNKGGVKPPHSKMIGHLSGTLLAKQPTSAIVDVGGVGYEVAIPVSTFYELGENGSPVQLRVYTHVSQDAIRLYGFKTTRERELFLQLISVNGVGPGLAIKLLSGMNAEEMIAAERVHVR